MEARCSQHESEGKDEGPDCTETNSNSSESISDEERVRRLFAVCDADGDGYIDRYWNIQNTFITHPLTISVSIT